MIQKFRKRPVVVEALLFSEDLDFREVGRFMNAEVSVDFRKGGVIIPTSEGDMLASFGDYIVKEPFDKERGFYPCKPEIFKKTYELVEDK